jgi:hypothetical protein
MNKKRLILLGGFIALLAAAFYFLYWGPTSHPFAKRLSGKEAFASIGPAEEALGVDGFPVYIEGNVVKPGYPLIGGKAPSWDAGFYSESEKMVTDVRFPAAGGAEVKVLRKEKFGSGVSLAFYDLAGSWKIDSSEACRIATEHGVRGEITRMRLQTAGLDDLDIVFEVPEFVPESCKLFWVLFDDTDECFFYINACTGEFLGSAYFGDLNAIER